MKSLCMAISLSVVVLLSVFSAGPAVAWGEFGHLTICDLAYRNLTDPAKAELKRLFNEPDGVDITGLDGKVRHYTSFNVSCLEEDERPRKNPDDHFINVTRDTAAIEGSDCPGQTSCVLNGIGRDFTTLKDASLSAEKRINALLAIGHWVGDTHQPLHVSFADDLGGNNILVALEGSCGTTSFTPKNLHALWDSCLLEAGMFERVRQSPKFKQSWDFRTITYRAVDKLLCDTNLSAEKEIVATREPWQWAAESYEITLRPEVRYCTMVNGVCQYDADHVQLTSTNKKDFREIELGQDYLEEFEGIAEERLRFAGFRLAHIVNQALDPAYSGPIENSGQKAENCD